MHEQEEELVIDDRPKGLFCCWIFNIFRSPRKPRDRSGGQPHKMTKSNEGEMLKEQETTAADSQIVEVGCMNT